MVDYGSAKKASSGRARSLSFAEIVGQDELKRALLATATDDALDGLLIEGEKGTAKSTAVRALADLLPTQRAVEDCPYGCPPDAPGDQCADCRERTDPPTTERSVPLVTLPLGATRERVVGALSVADALAGDHQFDPGLLARANRGILYVDEVNLLDDHLVDVLLDAAASGVNSVERDGVSVSHPARFTLVGTMNPEEGDLRPQLRDRFALQATVAGCDDVDERVAIIDRAMGRSCITGVGGASGGSGESSDGGGDGAGSGDSNAGTGDTPVEDRRTQLRRARDLLPDVELPAEFAREIAALCRDAGVDGHRGDIATARAATAFAALDGRSKVLETDVREAAALALPHRLRSRPFEDAPDPDELVDDHFDGETGDDDQAGEEPDGSEGTDESGDAGEDTGDQAADRDDSDGPEDVDEGGGSHDADPGGEFDDADDGAADPGTHGPSGPGNDREGSDDGTSPPTGGDETATDGAEAAPSGCDEESSCSDEQTEGAPIVPGQSGVGIGEGAAPDLTAPDVLGEGGTDTGGRTRARPDVQNEGARVRSRRAESGRRIDAAASVRAAGTRGATTVESRDLRQSVRESDASALVVFAVDASASMRPAMRAAKGTVLELLKDAYRQRDEVAFVAFAGDGADVLLPPTDSVTLAARHLKDLPTGDRTPLPAGLRTAADVVERADPAASVVVLVTDGRANVADGSPVAETRRAARRLAGIGARVVVVDASDGDRSGVADLVADETDGDRVPLTALSAGRIDAAAGAARES